MGYFVLEPMLVERIKQEVPGLVEVNTPFNIEEMLEASNNSPSVSIIYYDDRVAGDAGRGEMSVTYQQWLVVLSVRHSGAQLQETSVIRKEAEPFIDRILDAMKGFNPQVVGFKTFKRTNSPVRVGGKAGHCYFPFMFEIQKLI